MKVMYDEPIPIVCDNTSSIYISNNHVLLSETKHIPIKYYFLKEHVVDQIVRIVYIETKEKKC